jgi:hypothetical protein
MHLDARSIGRLRRPEVQVFVSAGFKVERVVAVVEVGEFGEQV